MTHEEFQDWLRLSLDYPQAWKADQVFWHNAGDLLLYKGGQNGCFILIDSLGGARLGTYDGAIMKITDATFTNLASKQYDNFEQAVERFAANGISTMPQLLRQLLVSDLDRTPDSCPNEQDDIRQLISWVDSI